MIYGVLNGSNGRGQTTPSNSFQTTPVIYEDRRRKLMASEQYEQQQRSVMSSIERTTMSVKKNRQYFTDTI